jgi:hypothetical protein
MSSTVTSAARPGCAEIMCSTASAAEVGSRPARKATSIRAGISLAAGCAWRAALTA